MQSDDAGDVHDRPGAALHHPASRRAARVEDAAEVRREDVVPILVGHAREQAVAGHARVVDEDVQLPGLLDQLFRLAAVGDVRLDRRRPRRAGNRFGLLLARAVAERHARAGARQLERDRTADSP